MRAIDIERIQLAIISGASFKIDNSFSFLFTEDDWISKIDQINSIPQEGMLLNPGVEIHFKAGLPAPTIVVPIDSMKQDASDIANIGNIFELTITSSPWNRLFGMHGFNKFGLDIINTNGDVLDIVKADFDVTEPSLTDKQFNGGTRIAIPIGFTVYGVRLYFIKTGTITPVFQSAKFIFRILGSVIPAYFDLVQKKYEFEQAAYVFDPNDRTKEKNIPEFFGLFDFINYYDTIESNEVGGPPDLTERKNFIQRVLREDYNRLNNIEGFRDMRLDSEILKRIDSVFLPSQEGSHNHLSTDTDYLVSKFDEIVDFSPEKCCIAELLNIPDSYFAVFDADYYQYDIIDLVADENVKFSKLTSPEFNKGCKAAINGPYWDLSREKEGRLTGVLKENLFGALNVIGTIKSVPKGNTRFRDGKTWEPDKWIDYHHNTLMRVNAADPTRYFFYQTNSGDLKFGRGLLPSVHDINPSDAIAVGCDYLVGFVNRDQYNNDRIILDADTEDWVYPNDVADFNANFELHSSSTSYQYEEGKNAESSSKGFPLFGTILKNGKKYLFFFVGIDNHPYRPGFAIDDEIHARPRMALNFLKEIGAQNIFFTDGGTSAAFMFSNVNVIKNSRSIKDPLISAAIGIKAKSSFSNLVITGAKVKFGGSKAALTQYLLADPILTPVEKETFVSQLAAQSSIPFIDNLDHPQTITSSFGLRKHSGEWKFHEGLDIKAQNPLNVKLNTRGKVFRVGSPGGGFGNHVIINHGCDRYRNYYFSLFAHLSSVNSVPDQIVEKDEIIGVTGETDAFGQPHLHFELIKINKPFSAITYADICSRELHLDPVDFVLPSNLIFE